MNKLIELSKKYDFKVDGKSLIVPAHISSEDAIWLLNSGYHLTFKLSPLSYIWCEQYLKKKRRIDNCDSFWKTFEIL